MNKKNVIEKAIYPAMEMVRSGLQNPSGFTNSPETKLFGKDATLDSLSLVTLVIDVEQRVADVFQKPITLASEKAMSRTKSPFLTVDTLADYICELFDSKND